MRTAIKVVCFGILMLISCYDVVAAYRAGDFYSTVLCGCLLIILVVACSLSFGG